MRSKKENNLLAKDIRRDNADDEDKNDRRDETETRRMVSKDLVIGRLKQTVNKPEEPGDYEDRNNSGDRDKKPGDKFSLKRNPDRCCSHVTPYHEAPRKHYC